MLHLPVKLDYTPPDVITVFKDHEDIIINTTTSTTTATTTTAISIIIIITIIIILVIIIISFISGKIEIGTSHAIFSNRLFAPKDS